MSESIGAAFVRQAEAVLTHYPELRCVWDRHADGSGSLTFPPADETGFEISAFFDEHSVIVYAGTGAHEHFDSPNPGQTGADLAAEALGYVRDLLSPAARVRELSAAGKPYRWIVEVRTAAGWKPEAETGHLFWNYLGPRTERVYQNRVLPARDEEGGNLSL
jgi:hypothetical protein